MLVAHLILALSWIVYCVLHSLLASTRAKLFVQEKIKKGFRFYRFAYTIFSFLGLIAIFIYQFSLSSDFVFKPLIWVKYIGLVMMIAGGTLMILMIWKYFMQLSGVRWLTREEVGSKLEITGLHRIVRHPLYLGTFAFIWGWFLLTPTYSFLVSNSIITIYTLIGLEFEERKLIEEFGEDYIQYRKKVPRLIPRL